jgi:CO/xanthine dehydrogenase FAD-binding subunit
VTLPIEAPESAGEALALLAAEPDRVIVAGGTELVPAFHSGRRPAARLLSLGRVREIAGAGRTDDGGLFVGAGLSCARAAGLGRAFPGFGAAVSFGPPAVRSAATVGGNIVGSTGGDVLPLLLAAGARIELDSAAGRRSLAVAEFVAGDRLRRGELLVGVSVPQSPADAAVQRVTIPGEGRRAALVLAAVRDPEAPRIRIAVRVRSGPAFLVPAAEEVLGAELARSGRVVGAAVLAECAEAVARAVADGGYLRRAAAVCTGRALTALSVAA